MSAPKPIPFEEWMESAACAGHEKPEMWDDQVHGETPQDRHFRIEAAKRICKTECSVRDHCLARVDWTFDEGVRGGVVLPRKKHAARVPGRPPKPIVHGSRWGARQHYRRNEPACAMCRDAVNRWLNPNNPSQYKGRLQ